MYLINKVLLHILYIWTKHLDNMGEGGTVTDETAGAHAATYQWVTGLFPWGESSRGLQLFLLQN
jgi:hypothetical protein